MRIYFADAGELANAAANTPLSDAEAMLERARQTAQRAKDDADEVHERRNSQESGCEILRKNRALARKEHDSGADFEFAILNAETADHEAAAEKFAIASQRVTWLSAVISNYEQITRPTLVLGSLRADVGMFTSAGNFLMAQALVLAVKRHNAAKALVECDGTATIAASGRAHEALMAALQMHRRAAEASVRADAEANRQNLLKELQ